MTAMTRSVTSGNSATVTRRVWRWARVPALFLLGGTCSFLGGEVGSAIYRDTGLRVAGVLLLLVAVCCRRRLFPFALGIVLVTPVVTWFMAQGLAPMEGPM